jgi:hypothetical protein
MEHIQDERHALLARGSSVPDVDVRSADGPMSLRASIDRSDANVLVILSTLCTTALGELAGWRDAVSDDGRVRPLVVVAEADAGYVADVHELLGTLGYEILTIDRDALPMLGAEAVPVVYALAEGRRVAASAIGTQEVLGLREDLMLGRIAESNQP